MKTGLTQRGWNNVLIFASLFMIILFNSTHKKFIDGEDSAVKESLINADAIVQTLDFSGIKIERIGASWRVVTSVASTKNVDASSLTSAWQQQRFDILQNEPELLQHSVRYPVIVHAHGYDQTQMFEVILEPHNDLAYVHHKTSGRWFVMNHSDALALLPKPLL